MLEIKQLNAFELDVQRIISSSVCELLSNR